MVIICKRATAMKLLPVLAANKVSNEHDRVTSTISKIKVRWSKSVLSPAIKALDKEEDPVIIRTNAYDKTHPMSPISVLRSLVIYRRQRQFRQGHSL